MVAPDLFLDFAGFVPKFRIHSLLGINHNEFHYCKLIHYSLQTLSQHKSEKKEETKA